MSATDFFIGYTTPIWIVVFAIFFYKMGLMEYKRGFLPCAFSILVSLISVFFFRFGLKGLLICQVLLYCCFWGYNILKEEKPPSLSNLKKMWKSNKKD